MQEFTVRPQPDDPRLTRTVAGIDQEGRADRYRRRHRTAADAVPQRARDRHDDDDRRPSGLSRGRLSAQSEHAARPSDRITGIDYDDELETVVVRTDRETDFEDKLRKKTLTSGCAQGTVFGDLMEKFDEVRLDPRRSAAHVVALCALPQDQHRAQPLSRRRGDPWLCVVRGRPAAPLYGGCRPPQRDRQDRRLYAPAPGLPQRARSSTPPVG